MPPQRRAVKHFLPTHRVERIFFKINPQQKSRRTDNLDNREKGRAW